MERTYARTPTTFETETRTIEITPTGRRRYTVRIRNGERGWNLVRTNLRDQKAAWLTLKALRCPSKKLLARAVAPGKITILLLDVPLKGTGAEWIAMRMLAGPRPIILRAPALFRHKVIHIEPTEREGTYRMRVVDPFTSLVGAPIDVDQTVVERAITVFNHDQEEHLEPGRESQS